MSHVIPREFVGQDDITGEPIAAVVVQHLREEEEDDVEELLHATAGDLATGQPGASSTSTPSGSQQQSCPSAQIRSTESFLGRVAVGSPSVSNASFLQGRESTAGRDVAADATSPHSPACSTSQTHSPHPSARRTATLPAQSLISAENQHLEGSQALGDFGADLDLEMGEQHRDEVESRERASPQRTPSTDLGKGPMVDEVEVHVRLFPTAFSIDEAYHPLLNAIARAHPETFAHFNPRSSRLGSIFLRDLHEGWVSVRSSALRAAGERAALRPEIQGLAAQLESARQHLASLEVRFAQVTQHDAELAAAALNLEDPDPNKLVFEEWLKGLLEIMLSNASLLVSVAKLSIFICLLAAGNTLDASNLEHFGLAAADSKSAGHALAFTDFQLDNHWGTVPRGPFVDHVLEYWLQREKENVLFVTYEELTEDPTVHVRRIAEFLGCSLSGDEVEQVVWKCSYYARLSKLGVNNGEEERVNFSGMKLSSFFRSGVVGDGKKLLSPEMTFGESPSRDINQVPSPRAFNTHLPYSILPEAVKNSGCRIIYISRNPADTFVSTWHFLYNKRFGTKIPLEVAFDEFCQGTVGLGPFVDHVSEYWLEREKENVLFVTYEELKDDPNKHVSRIAEFLGCSLSADEIDQVVYWRGVVGDGKNLLSPEMMERIETLANQRWEGSGLEIKMFGAEPNPVKSLGIN
ncbi:hypothetical protein C3L33_02947, partial [Rhododendron williamsianum]